MSSSLPMVPMGDDAPSRTPAETDGEDNPLVAPDDDPQGTDFELNIRTLTGQTIPITFLMAPGVTQVKVIKETVSETKDIPVDFQRLIFGGREIRDEEFISDLYLESGDTVHMLLRQNLQQAQEGEGEGARNAEEGRAGYRAGMDGIPVAAIPVGGGGGGGGAEDGADDDDRPSRLMRTMQLSRAVRIFAIIDAFFLILSAFSVWPLAIGVLLAICGYQGASQFRSGLTLCYLVYLVLATGLRGFWTVLSIKEEQYFVSVIMFMSVLIEVYIFYIVWRFLKLLRQATERDRQEMLEFMHAPAV